MAITTEQLKQLSMITPSRNGGLDLYPCQVEMNNGDVHECVYMVDYDLFVSNWSGLPPDETSSMFIPIASVKEIKASTNRLPLPAAQKLYNAGETGMGYCLFKIKYDDGSSLDVLTGNAVDFVPSPLGLTPVNIVDVLPHQGSQDFVKGLEYVWCLIHEEDIIPVGE